VQAKIGGIAAYASGAVTVAPNAFSKVQLKLLAKRKAADQNP